MNQKNVQIGPFRCDNYDKQMFIQAAESENKSLSAHVLDLLYLDAKKKGLDKRINFIKNEDINLIKNEDNNSDYYPHVIPGMGVILHHNNHFQDRLQVVVDSIDGVNLTGKIRAVFSGKVFKGGLVTSSELNGMEIEFKLSDVHAILRDTIRPALPKVFKSVHLIERRNMYRSVNGIIEQPPSLRPEDPNDNIDMDYVIFLSYSWKFRIETLEDLIGNNIYFHHNQKSGAWIAGQLLNYFPDKDIPERYVLRIKKDLSLNETLSPDGVKWAQHVCFDRY